jgi:hypothetical protein
MDVQVEVQFSIQHTIQELQQEFVQLGHFPDWKVIEDADTRPQLFFETRIVSVNLATPGDRQAWFVFSLEASGELRKRIVLPNVIPSNVNIHIRDLKEFLSFCRECLVSSPGSTSPVGP